MQNLGKYNFPLIQLRPNEGPVEWALPISWPDGVKRSIPGFGFICFSLCVC